MIKWIRRLWTRPTFPELDRRVAQSAAERDEAAQIRSRSEDMSARLAAHRRQNHFAERLESAILAAQRGRRA